MSCRLDMATTLVIKASTPYGVSFMTRRTRRITQACRVSMAFSTLLPFSGSSLNSCNAATPRKAANITTLMIEVGLARARSANGFCGINDSSNCGTFRSATLPAYSFWMMCRRLISAAPATRPSAVRPNRLVRPIPTSAAIMVVNSSVPMVRKLILPSEEALCRRATALRIEANTNGITIICSSCT